jgi:tetratricopeptide (TPR) repeat protein
MVIDSFSHLPRDWSVLEQVSLLETENREDLFDTDQLFCQEVQENLSDRLKLDELIESVKLAAKEFMERIGSLSWKKITEPDEAMAELTAIVRKIFSYREGLKLREEDQGPIYYLRSKLGFGDYLAAQAKLHELAGDLKRSWNSYFVRCQKVAEKELASGNALVALQKYRQLEKLVPDSTEVIDRIGDCCFEIGQKEKAVSCYDKLLARKVRQISCQFKKAHCLLDLGQAKEAHELLDALSNNTKVKEAALQRQVTEKEIVSKIELGRYLEAIERVLVAIEKHPQEDAFKLRLIDAYLGYGVELFRTNFSLVCEYFSAQSCYSIMSRTFGDAVQIVLDFFDYIAKKSEDMLVLFKEHVLHIKPTEQFVDIILSHLERKFESIERKKELLTEKIARLFHAIEASEFSDNDEIDLLRAKLLKYSEELVGGSRAEFPIGLINYCKFYSECIEELQNISSFQKMPLFKELLTKRDKLLSDLAVLVRILFKEGETELGLRQLFQKRLMIKARDDKAVQEEEVSSLDLSKRGHLMKVVEEALVPSDFKDELLKYLDEQGIDIELLFQTKLMDYMPKDAILADRGNTMAELKAMLIEEKIMSIANLKSYIQNPTNRREN